MHINQLDIECLENILVQLHPYQDLRSCSLVCKLWNSVCKSVARRIDRDFEQAIAKNNLICKDLSSSSNITARHSHASCIACDHMYIFGGCTTERTFFNDIWKFSLSTRLWSRPVSSGSYPPPKSKASMLFYNNQLLIYGGHTLIRHSFGREQWALFNHLHAYDLASNSWTLMKTVNRGPKSAAHSASIVNDSIVLFGGLRESEMDLQLPEPCNELWILDLKSLTWQQIQVNQLTPSPRFGHSQIVLDSQNILILGGCDTARDLLNSIWRLKLAGVHSYWVPVIVKPSCDPPPLQPVIHMNPAVKIGNVILVLNNSRSRRPCKSPEQDLVPFSIHRLDISTLLTTGCVCWYPSQSNCIFYAPEQLMLYTMSLGKCEMLLFGGLYYRGHQGPAFSSVTNKLHLITCKRQVT